MKYLRIHSCSKSYFFQCVASIGVLLLGVSAISNAAEKQLTPGLWEHAYKIKTEGGQLEAALAQAEQTMKAMPSDQRAMIENMMRARGIDLNLRSYTTQICITPEQASKGTLPKPTKNCTQAVAEETNTGYKIRYECTGNPPTSGEGEMVFIDNKNYSITVKVNTEVNNQPETMTVLQNGKWIGKQCAEPRK